MTLALKWGTDGTTDLNSSTSGFVYFDAVSVFTTSYTGQVTKHPVDSGGNISDHFIVDNPRFTISACISAEDISTSSFLIQDQDGNTPYNVRVAPSAVSVNSTDQSVLRRFIPDSIGQFLSDSTPDIQVDSERENLLSNIKDLLLRLVFSRDADDTFVDNKINLLKILEFDGLNIRKVSHDVVMTGITFREDANSGDGLFCDMTFEQVSFSFLKKTTIPKNITSSLNKKGSEKSTKSKATGTEIIEPATPSQDDTDGSRSSYGQVVTQERFRLGQPLNSGNL